MKQSPRSPHLKTAAEFELLLKKDDGRHYVLRLYVTGTSARSSKAIANIHALCEECLPGRYDLEVIDIYQQPSDAQTEQIIAAPTLIKSQPLPSKRMVGDLGNREKILVALDLSVPH